MPRASQGTLHAALPFPSRVHVQGQGPGRLLMSHSWFLCTGRACHRTLCHHTCPSSAAKPPRGSGSPSHPELMCSGCVMPAEEVVVFPRLGLLKIYMVTLKGQ